MSSLLKIQQISKTSTKLGRELEKVSISAGSFGEVYSAKHKSLGTERAVKRINKAFLDQNHGTSEQILKEFRLLKQLDHPNVMKVYEAYEDAKNIYIVTELLKGGELFDKLIEEGQLIESTCAKLIKQILYALSYCHDKKLVHR